MIGIIDLGISNIGSVLNMFKYVGLDAKVIKNKFDLEVSSKLVLPGLGHFDRGMANLEKSGLMEVLNSRVLEDKVPILGICLGMQLMCLSSDEGKSNGLGWIDAKVKDFRKCDSPPKKTPHMGWNLVSLQKTTTLSDEFEPETRFYFVHSYYVECANQSDVLVTTKYGIEFVSAFQVDNIIGTQFHPEKSHIFGAHLLKKFGNL